jgi:hypothetical protein
MSPPPRLAILIPTIDGREGFLEALRGELERQRLALANPDDVLVLVNKDDQTKTIGRKRNELMDAAVAAGATHRAFVDDDDVVSPNYLAANLPGVHGGFDCNALVGRYYVEGVFDRPFYHSLRYTHWWHDAAGYYRNPNHLNVMKIDLIKHIRFQEKSFGEDGCFSEQIASEGLLKTELAIDDVIYHYYSRCKPPHEIDRMNRQGRTSQ